MINFLVLKIIFIIFKLFICNKINYNNIKLYWTFRSNIKTKTAGKVRPGENSKTPMARSPTACASSQAGQLWEVGLNKCLEA